MPKHSLLLFLLGISALSASILLERTNEPSILRLTWPESSTLQQSEQLGSWEAVPDVSSPYLINTAQQDTEFFRLHPIADTVIQNAKIHTVDPTQPSASIIAIKEGRILFIGDEIADEYLGPDTETIDASERLVLPGFQDVHVHAIEAGINEGLSILPQYGSTSVYRAALRELENEQPGGPTDWIIGAGVNMIALLESVPSPLELIDDEIPTRPTVILDDLGHGAWANTVALRAIDINQKTENPPGGLIDFDETNQPSGVVFENLSQTLIDASQPPTIENLDFAYERFLEVLVTFAKNGITSVSDAGGYWPRGHHNIWRRAEDEGTLTVRANNAFYVYPEKNAEAQMDAITALRMNDADKLVRFNQVKIYIDGIISQTTAALLSPYEKEAQPTLASPRGFTYFDTKTLHAYAAGFEAAGFQLHFHATGDRGTRLALDAIEHAQSRNGSQDRRHRITHVYLVDPADVKRFKQLGVYADFQLSPSSLTAENLSDAAFYLGDRIDHYLPASALFESGAELTLSSDFDADSLSPFVKIETALSAPGSHRIPDVETAIRLMTIQAAKLLHHETHTGSLSVGKYADLIILDQDIRTIPREDISKTSVLLTMLAGKEVYRSPKF